MNHSALINNTHDDIARANLFSKYKRFDIINYLIKKNGFSSYLEIGVFTGENIRKIEIENKDGVDPGTEGFIVPEVNYPISSDDFFALLENNPKVYDLIFIDGLHHAEQVDKDIANALKYLSPKGYIVVHDSNPISFEAQSTPRETLLWNGDVWKSIVKLRTTRSDLQIRVVDTDFGLGLINFGYMDTYKTIEKIDWEYFSIHKKKIVNLISVAEFKQLYLNLFD